MRSERPMIRRSVGILLGVALLSPALAIPSSADWLVMRDGAVLETLDGWTVEGRRVIFTRANGTLSAVRLQEVDLEASEEWTRHEMEQALAPAPASEIEEELPPPRWVWTNEDIPEVEEEEQGLQIESIVGAAGFELLDVQEAMDASGESLVVTGSLLNSRTDHATGVQVQVSIRSPDHGGVIEEGRARLGSPNIPPGAATKFVVNFVDLKPGLGEIQVRVVADESDSG